MRRVFTKLLKSQSHVKSSRGATAELAGVLLKIENPRARLSRTEKRGMLFSCLGEFLWYMSKTNNLQFITYYLPDYKHYSDDGRTIHGGYGPRLFNARGNNQVTNIEALLKKKPESRRAVIQLFDANDLAEDHEDIPCTCTLQFMIRRGYLHMCTYMRSNDAFMGLPHDIFAFTMLQEIMARALSVELGVYKHAVGSLHLYEKNIKDAQQYLDEGWQSTMSMPSMPAGDPWPSMASLLRAEAAIRRGKGIDIRKLELDAYWADLVRLLQIFQHSKKKEYAKIARLKGKMSSNIYNTYIEKRQAKKWVAATVPEQLRIPGAE